VLPLSRAIDVARCGGTPLDRQFSPSTLPDAASAQYTVMALELVNLRTNCWWRVR
jgi:hypothetical protein